jgi:hypothetical protein
MIKTIRNAALTLAVGLGALAAMPATAEADGLYFSFGSGGSRAGVYLGDGGHVRHWDRNHGRHWKNDHHRWKPRNRCTNGRALDKAANMGVRRAYVSYASDSTITVRGRALGDSVRVRFSRAPGCPVIGY